MKLKFTHVGIVLLLSILPVIVSCAQSNTEAIDSAQNDVTLMIDGREKLLTDVPGEILYPMIYDDIVYVPVKSFSEQLGKEAYWDKESNIVSINNGILSDEMSSVERIS